MELSKGAEVNLIREVAEEVNRPFAEKYLETQGLIAHNLMQFKGKVAVAFSGGKDSLVVLHIAWQLQPDVLVVFNNTGVEYPETVSYIAEIAEQWKLNLMVTRPEKTYWDVVGKSGYDTGKRGKQSDCCYWVKEKPMKAVIKACGIEAELTGITAVENRTRMFNARDYGTCHYSTKTKTQRIHPILWWTPDEVREYITSQELPMNPVYAKGAERVGCMPCTAHKFWEEQMRKVNPKLYEIIKLRKDHQYVMRLNA